jgi:hypothetical protein
MNAAAATTHPIPNAILRQLIVHRERTGFIAAAACFTRTLLRVRSALFIRAATLFSEML